MALDAISVAHQALADEYDFDLVGNTRAAATWQMTGRCIGLARAILDMLVLGYTSEAVHLGRALHEAARLLDAIGDPDEPQLLKRWLDGKRVSPSEVRKAEQRFEDRLATIMVSDGDRELPRTETPTRKVYAELSEAAHHLRRWVQDAVAPELRTMARGQDTAWLRRAATTSVLLMMVGEGIDSTGGAVERFRGPPWFVENVKPYEASFAALALAQPLH